MRARPLTWYWIVPVFVISLGYALGLQQWLRPLTADGVHFHPWSSEDMMQTVSLRELRRNPLESLANIHMQPPAFDAIRAVLAQFWPGVDDEAALLRVDRALQVLNSILLASMVTLVYAWLAARAGPVAGAVGALILLLHPATIMFATFMDGTFISAFLIPCTCYLLWRLTRGLPTPIFLFGVVVLALFFTRSIFQWPALLLFALCLWLIRAHRPQVVAYILITGLLSTLYLTKQYRQFGIFSSSSMSAVSLANSIGAGIGTAKYAAYLQNTSLPTRVQVGMPAVLSAPPKLDGQPNFNHIDYLELNRQLSIRYLQALQRDSLADLIGSYVENTGIYFRPSSTYSSGHVIVERLPWRSAFERVFSAPILPALLLIASAIWCITALRARTFCSSLGVLLPAMFVIVVSILG